MNKKLDLIKLAQGMNVKDKAKLLFADCRLRFETLGTSQLLNAYEQERLTTDAQKNKQIVELNALIDKFNVSCFLLNEIKICYLNFYSEEVKLEMFLAAVALRDHYEDGLDFLIYCIASDKYSLEERQTTEAQKTIEVESQAIRAKHHLTSDDKFSKIFDLFDPPIHPESSSSVGDTKVNHTPNILIQKIMVRLVGLVKKLNTAIYKFEYLEQLAEINLVSEKEYKEIEAFKHVISLFTNLDSLAQLKIYTFEPFINDLNITHLEEPSFFIYLKDLNKATELSEEEKVEASKHVDLLLELV